MKRTTLNLGPFGIYLWGGILLASGLAVAGGAALTVNTNTGTIYTKQLANGTPNPGKFVRAGYCTGTETGVGTGTSDRQCWSTIRASDVQDLSASLPSDPLGTFFLQGCTQAWCSGIRTAARWNELDINTGSSYEATGTCSTGSDALIATAWTYAASENRRLWPGGTWIAKLKSKVNANGAAIRVEVYEGETLWFNWTTNSFINTDYQTIEKAHTQAERVPAGDSAWLQFKFYATCSTETTVTVEFAAYGSVGSRIESPLAREAPRISDVRLLQAQLDAKEPKLPAGQPSQVVCYTGGGTSTSTSKTACTLPTGMPPGTTPGQVPVVSAQTGTYTYTATGTPTGARTGTETTTGTEWTAANANTGFDPMGTYYLGNCEGVCAVRWRQLPGATWPYSVNGTCSTGSDALLGEYVLYNRSVEYRKLWPAGAWLANLKAYTDSAEHGAAVRVEVWDNEEGGSSVQWFNWTTGVFSGTTAATVQKMTVQGERTVATSPGHYLSFKLYATCSTSTLVTVSEARIESPFTVDYPIEIADVNGLQGALDGKAAPVTARKFTVPATAFVKSPTLSVSQLGSFPVATWALRDGATDYVYSHAFSIPADYSSDLAVSVIWSPASTDATAAHKVRWILGLLSLIDGTAIGSGLASASWDGDTCEARCTSGYVLKEAAHSVSASFAAASSPYLIYFKRDGSSGNDTYVGDSYFLGLEFSYTSSL